MTFAVLTIVISLAALFALAGLFQLTAARRDARTFPPPGRMIDIGGRRLHARVEGRGAPPVIFDAGFSATSVSWSVVQPRVAEFTASVCYDRAGLGWSDPARELYDANRMVADLAALLDGLRLPPPYVLVGHSFGGLLVRLYAERYPEEIAGLVLIDPVLACCWAHPNSARAAVLRRAAVVARWGARCARFGLVRLATVPAVVKSVIVPRFGGRGESAEGVIDRLQTELVKLPPETIPVIRSHWCRPKNFEAMVRHLAAFAGSFALLRNQPLDFPVTVVSGGNLSPEELAEHRAIAALSPRGRHTVADHSGHWIQFDEPHRVVEAIREILS